MQNIKDKQQTQHNFEELCKHGKSIDVVQYYNTHNIDIGYNDNGALMAAIEHKNVEVIRLLCSLTNPPEILLDSVLTSYVITVLLLCSIIVYLCLL